MVLSPVSKVDRKLQCLKKEVSALPTTMLVASEPVQSRNIAETRHRYITHRNAVRVEGERGVIHKSPHTLVKISNGDRSPLLHCTHLKFDKDNVNVNKVHITPDGNLVNQPDTAPHDYNKFRLAKYEGTTSTDPVPMCGVPQYWEIKPRVVFEKPLTGNPILLETGICTEKERDHRHLIADRLESHSFNVAMCPTHNSIYRESRSYGKYVRCEPNTIPNAPRQSAFLHYGILFDCVRRRLVFLDITENKVISVLDDIDCSRPLWPMFGVYNPHLCSVSMSLVVGEDIQMTQEKVTLILHSMR